jgi:hypothetical protein
MLKLELIFMRGRADRKEEKALCNGRSGRILEMKSEPERSSG